MSLSERRQSPPEQIGVDLMAATFASLNSRATSHEAKQLVSSIAERLRAWELESGNRKHKRNKTAQNLRLAVESFVGDLLLAQEPGRASNWIYRAAHPRGFTGQQVSADSFKKVVEGLEHFGLIERRSAFTRFTNFGDNTINPTRFAPRFRATAKFVELAQQFGVSVTLAKAHFLAGDIQSPLVLRATNKSAGGNKERGRLMKIPDTPEVKTLQDQVEKLSKFLTRFTLSGGIHRAFVRVFNNGDDPKFAWNMGGRLYSVGDDSYQRLSESERLKMTIDDEDVCELDITASNLTILYAQNGLPLPVFPDEDPYAIDGLPREIVKAWITIQLGKKNILTRWPSKNIIDYAEDSGGRRLSKDFPVKGVGEAITQRFRLLKRWSKLPDTWATLMYRESEAVLNTMIELMDRQIPSLPVHDSIIVPASKETIAYDIFRSCYKGAVGVLPTLKVNKPLQHS